MLSILYPLAFSPVMAAPVGFLGFFASIWCCGGVLVVGQFVVFILALVQILSRNMPTEAKLLWGAVAWFVPVIGPILWWTIGSKQNPALPHSPPEPPVCVPGSPPVPSPVPPTRPDGQR